MWQWREQIVDEPARARRSAVRWQWQEESLLPPCYISLGVPSLATSAEIRQAYRRLAHRLHPDVRPSTEQRAAAREMAELNAAYRTLADPARRAAYDREHGIG